MPSHDRTPFANGPSSKKAPPFAVVLFAGVAVTHQGVSPGQRRLPREANPVRDSRGIAHRGRCPGLPERITHRGSRPLKEETLRIPEQSEKSNAACPEILRKSSCRRNLPAWKLRKRATLGQDIYSHQRQVGMSSWDRGFGGWNSQSGPGFPYFAVAAHSLGMEHSLSGAFADINRCSILCEARVDHGGAWSWRNH
jgi:hypothetical protein